ncbi:hypothetical protein AB6735_07675 [Mucilaginibacter sp. RCC_168]|uniref:hypothetical protein n=1 Tax=Mucilaginibacter sp. RCC_168 TaxID=3239221 RepID=UPI003525BA36
MTNYPKFHPSQTRAVLWNKIEERYADFVNHGFVLQPILSLVQFIRENGFNKRLHAFTSMHKLVISIYDPLEWDRETLHIELDIPSKKVHFVYCPKPFEPSEAVRSYPEEDIIPRFSRYMSHLKW